jgi:CHAT domain-containing protein/Tfp pilus assembly protein PilF
MATFHMFLALSLAGHSPLLFGADVGLTGMEAGFAAFDKGDFAEAAADWKKAAQRFEEDNDRRRQVEALINLGIAYQSLGQPWLCIRTLEHAVAVAEKSKDRGSLVSAKSNLGSAYLMSHRWDRSEEELRESLAAAREARDVRSQAVILNDLGRLLAEQSHTAEALESFQQSASLAHLGTNDLLAAKAKWNAAATAAQAGDFAEAERLNGNALDIVRPLPPSHDQVLLLLSVGKTDWRISQRTMGGDPRLQKRAEECYLVAMREAEKLGDLRAKTYALGYLGQISESKKEFADALALTRQAVFVAQQAQSPDALYRWEWQSARILQAQGDVDSAIMAYRRALQTLHGIGLDLSLGYTAPRGSFREEIGPIYFEFADLLLQQARKAKGADDRQRMLLEARDAVEQLKSVELEDYFQDPCVNILRSKAARIEGVDPHTAVIYIIPLADRTELLVGFSQELKAFSSPVGAMQLTAMVRDFRVNLEKRTTEEYLTQAQQLYQWLIVPCRSELVARKIQTLVFVPDGALRTVPMAALHDGERFLIEQFAVSVSPGLTLMEPKPISRKGTLLLEAGLSQAVQGYAPLPNVPAELEGVHKLFGGSMLLDQEFLVSSLQKGFVQGQYQIVHLASHGEFDREAGKTFILTYDSKLTLDMLEELLRPSQFHGKPVELLTLSACQTAAGDDRAALGLAGIAVKAGARSALATLWSINDQSTALLVTEFYGYLRGDSHLSKAQALQQAQLKLLQESRYAHPCHWAPYLIIGNWL